MNLDRQLDQIGIPQNLIALHQSRIRRWISEGRSHGFKIVDSCRLNNAGILKLSRLTGLEHRDHQAMKIAAFVPAAGASSRYYQIFDQLLTLLNHPIDSVALAAHLSGLPFKNWPIFPELTQLLMRWQAGGTVGDADVALLKQSLALPKALQPTSAVEKTFLAAKVEEHQAIKHIDTQIFITSPQSKESFASELKGKPCKHPVHLLEQGPDLSTIRFNIAGDPWFDQDGNISVVPAGHGALSRLFIRAKELTRCDALFIRNIDNHTGVSADVIDACNQFFQGSRRLFGFVADVRAALTNEDLHPADDFASNVLKSLELPKVKSATRWDGAENLASVQLNLFHTPQELMTNAIGRLGLIKGMRELFARPLNILGQVPNINHDVGGTPCFVNVHGSVVKLCLEVPHASAEDREHFLANPAKATHFNPVFALSEVPNAQNYYDDLSNDFWVVSEKTHARQKVLYHETVLYELIGNSLASNCVFVEVPRMLFRPHKAVQDGAVSAR